MIFRWTTRDFDDQQPWDWCCEMIRFIWRWATYEVPLEPCSSWWVWYSCFDRKKGEAFILLPPPWPGLSILRAAAAAILSMFVSLRLHIRFFSGRLLAYFSHLNPLTSSFMRLLQLDICPTKFRWSSIVLLELWQHLDNFLSIGCSWCSHLKWIEGGIQWWWWWPVVVVRILISFCKLARLLLFSSSFEFNLADFQPSLFPVCRHEVRNYHHVQNSLFPYSNQTIGEVISCH